MHNGSVIVPKRSVQPITAPACMVHGMLIAFTCTSDLNRQEPITIPMILKSKGSYGFYM